VDIERVRQAAEAIRPTGAWEPLCELADVIACAHGHGETISWSIDAPTVDDFVKAVTALRHAGQAGGLLAIVREAEGLRNAGRLPDAGLRKIGEIIDLTEPDESNEETPLRRRAES
jgi:hypothetical protein